MDNSHNTLDFLQCSDPERQVQALAVINKNRDQLFYQIVDSTITHNHVIYDELFEKQSKGLLKEFKITKQDYFSCISDSDIINQLLSGYDELGIVISDDNGDKIDNQTIYLKSVEENKVLDYVMVSIKDILEDLHRIGYDGKYTLTFRINGLYITCIDYDVAFSKILRINPIILSTQNIVSTLCNYVSSYKFNFSKNIKQTIYKIQIV